ncbi:unnamed protein product [Dovyalis caffra]|uniref:Uncharacterized protein n=1 Tax=Dovyalis caffra TaxID=77055 RepID=A0AAV1R7E5_9ROSI|nr:unnamed protein product [Dovyalis caffra]
MAIDEAEGSVWLVWKSANSRESFIPDKAKSQSTYKRAFKAEGGLLTQSTRPPTLST